MRIDLRYLIPIVSPIAVVFLMQFLVFLIGIDPDSFQVFPMVVASFTLLFSVCVMLALFSYRVDIGFITLRRKKK